jgi:hypothetical protein
MGFFKSKKQAPSAGSTSESAGGDPERKTATWSWKKPRGTQPDAGSIPSSSINTTTPQERLGDGPKATPPSHHAPQDREKLNHAQSLWDCAYDTLKKDQPDLVTKYEKLLSEDLSKNGAFISPAYVAPTADLGVDVKPINSPLTSRKRPWMMSTT